jgi:hypothetical protein
VQSGVTVYLETIVGTTRDEVLSACAALRQDPAILCASPRLIAGGDPRYLTEEILVRFVAGTLETTGTSSSGSAMARVST